jgi:hypothetical protein
MTIFLVWKEKLDTFSEDGDLLIAVCSTMEKALLHVDKPNFDVYITETKLDSDDQDFKVVYGR